MVSPSPVRKTAPLPGFGRVPLGGPDTGPGQLTLPASEPAPIATVIPDPLREPPPAPSQLVLDVELNGANLPQNPAPPVTPPPPANPVPADSVPIPQVNPAPSAPQPQPTPDPAPVATPTPEPTVTPAPEPDVNDLILGKAPTPEPARVDVPDTGFSAVASHLQAKYALNVASPDEATKIYDNAIEAYLESSRKAQELEAKNAQLQALATDPRLQIMENPGVQEILGLLEEARIAGVKNVLGHVAERLAPLASSVEQYTQDQLIAISLREAGVSEENIPAYIAEMRPYEKDIKANETRRRLAAEREKKVAELNKIKNIQPQAAPDPIKTKRAQEEAQRALAAYQLHVLPKVQENLRTLNGHTLKDDAVNVLLKHASTYMQRGENGRVDLETYVLLDENEAFRPEVLAALAPFDRRLPQNAREMLTKPRVNESAIRAQIRQELLAEFAQTNPAGTAPATGTKELKDGQPLTLAQLGGKLGAIPLKQS